MVNKIEYKMHIMIIIMMIMIILPAWIAKGFANNSKLEFSNEELFSYTFELKESECYFNKNVSYITLNFTLWNPDFFRFSSTSGKPSLVHSFIHFGRIFWGTIKCFDNILDDRGTLGDRL